MRFLFLVMALFAVFTEAPVARAEAMLEPEAVRAVIKAVVEDVVLPGYGNFEAKAEDLASATEELCRTPSPEALAAARDAFRGAVEAWGRVAAISFGPARDENRAERVLFYPDPHGIGMRQVRSILATKNESATDPASLKEMSVAAQGLTALDVVLFGEGSDMLAAADGAAFRCRYGAAIGQNLASIGVALHAAWEKPDGVAADWKNAGKAGSAFGKADEALLAVLTSLVHGLEEVEAVWIGSFFAETPSKDQPKRAVFHRSAETMPFIAADLEGMRKLFVEGRMASVLQDSEGWIPKRVVSDFDAIIAEARAIREPLVTTMADIPNRQRFIGLLDRLLHLKSGLGNAYGPAIGLSTGFSFADGD